MKIDITTRNAKRLQALLRDDRFIKGPLSVFLRQSAFVVEARAKDKAPVDTGRLRAGMRTDTERLRAIVYNPVKYAPFVEFGTRPHFPPISAMQPWARRHGFPAGNAGAYMVARAIAARGTRAQPFLIPALKESEPEIRGLLNRAIDSFEEQWERNG